MQSIRIDTGVKRIMVNDDPARVIQFNPSDVTFAEKFYGLMGDFQAKQREYKRRSDEIEANTGTDENGLPANLPAGLALLREACEYMNGKLDQLFGAGTAQAAFDGALTLEQYEQFFEGITPFFQTAREDKMKRYLNDKLAGKVME